MFRQRETWIVEKFTYPPSLSLLPVPPPYPYSTPLNFECCVYSRALLEIEVLCIVGELMSGSEVKVVTKAVHHIVERSDREGFPCERILSVERCFSRVRVYALCQFDSSSYLNFDELLQPPTLITPMGLPFWKSFTVLQCLLAWLLSNLRFGIEQASVSSKGRHQPH